MEPAYNEMILFLLINLSSLIFTCSFKWIQNLKIRKQNYFIYNSKHSFKNFLCEVLNFLPQNFLHSHILCIKFFLNNYDGWNFSSIDIETVKKLSNYSSASSIHQWTFEVLDFCVLERYLSMIPSLFWFFCLLDFPICWHRAVCGVSGDSSHFCNIHCYIFSSLISLISLISVLSISV